MKCLDDCHTYELDRFLSGDGQFKPSPDCHESPRKDEVHFYEMRPDGTRIDGVTNEEVLRVLIHRLTFLNDGKFRCRENSLAITKLEEALMWLEKRTAERTARKVEGTRMP